MNGNFNNLISKFLFIVSCMQVLYSTPALSSGLTLQECHILARENYPNIKNQHSYMEILSLNTEKLQANWLPQLSISGQLIYQSDVFRLPFEPPGIEIVKLPRERYQTSFDISQTIYDGGLVKAQKMLEHEQYMVQMSELNAELLQLKSVVNELFFGVLLMQKTDSILKNTTDLLEEKIRALGSAFHGGVATESDLLRVETEILKTRQQLVENEEALASFKEMLETIVGEKLDGKWLIEPGSVVLPNELIPSRPEIEVLNYRQKAFQVQQHLVNANLHPRISFFASAGIGYPNPFNFYEVGASPFYILGAKANWRFWDWQSTARESQVLKIREDVIENNKSNFNRSISLKLSRLRSDVEKYRKLMEYDLEIVTARERIRKLSSLRLDEGIISSSEFAEDVSAEKVARINLQIHRIKWIMAGINVLTEYGIEYN